MGLIESDKLSKPCQTDEETKKLFKDYRPKRNTYTNFYTSGHEISFDKVKKSYKKYGNATFNDLMLGIMSKSFKPMLVKKGVKNPKEIKIAIPIAMKDLPTGYHDLQVLNKLSAVSPCLPICDSIEE